MQPMNSLARIRTKICCISSLEEAQLAIRHGADALGLVGPMPSGPGILEESAIRAIARQVPPPVSTFLLTSETTIPNIIAQYQRVHTSAIQLVDTLQGAHRDLRKALPNIRLIQVIHVVDERSVQEALAIAPEVDALLLDSGRPSATVRELGGTGRVHNWALSQRIVANSSVPVFLAGGLNADNAQAALQTVRPFGLDLCSGVRTHQQLDEAKLRAFMQVVRLASA